MVQPQRTGEIRFDPTTFTDSYANTTPFPNYLLNEIMPKLKDTEWRLICVVVRQTLGWKDQATGIRKTSDWMTRRQLIEKTGRNSEALSKAVDALVQQNLVEARNKLGKSLSMPEQRKHGRGRIYYALHPSIIQRINKKNAGYATLQNKKTMVLEPDVFWDELTKTEHQHQSSAPLSSIFGREDRKSEHRNVLKSNTTKETQTKETVTKILALPNVRSWYANGSEDKLWHLSNLQSLPLPMQEFTAIYSQRYQSCFSHTAPPTVFASSLVRLHKLQQKYSEEELVHLLDVFFSCGSAHIKHQRHSLDAFVHNVNIL